VGPKCYKKENTGERGTRGKVEGIFALARILNCTGPAEKIKKGDLLKSRSFRNGKKTRAAGEVVLCLEIAARRVEGQERQEKIGFTEVGKSGRGRATAAFQNSSRV